MKYIIATRILNDSCKVDVELFEFKSNQDRKSFIKDIDKISGFIGYATTEISSNKKRKQHEY